MKTTISTSDKRKILIIASIFAILCIAMASMSHTASAAETPHPTFAWGEEEAQQALIIGWGCPLEAPIQAIRTGAGAEILGYINFIIPLGEMAAILTGWLLAIAAYYTASIILRWAKAIS